ncbi:MAG: hypothetical protein ACOC6L_02530 [Thermodesulfobacteriota bacterium]
MNYSIDELKGKILEFHPEIKEKNVDLEVSFNEGEGKYEVRLKKGGEEFGAFLEKQDADECMGGKKCVALAILVTQLMAELEDLLSPRRQ